MEIFHIVNAVRQKLSQYDALQVSEILNDKPISQDELSEIESHISFKFPDSLRHLFINHSSSLRFSWDDDGKRFFGEDCRYGGLNLISPIQIKNLFEDMREMVEETKAELSEEYDEGKQALVDDWSFWIPIVLFHNGDAFCIDTRTGNIVFLEHDVMDGGPNLHGIVLAQNIDDLISKWSIVGFVDIYDWTEGVNDDGINIESPVFSKLVPLFV
ncbi:cell wall assembly regulator SMI1 [Neobacillus sp. B4I6]|uniref:SMI1/KNR4 family protein n=1 Tax=Neobacillus sp. B4I6 TaxID=3373925 RepID=UPI003D20E129